MESEKVRLLYIDDEESNLHAFKASFRRYYDIQIALSPAEAKKMLDESEFAVIITDNRMPEMTGVEFLESISESHPDQVRILLTGYSDLDSVISAINKGRVFRYVTKPWDENELRMSIDNAAEVFRLQKENKKLVEDLKLANEQLEFHLRQQLLS